VDEELRVATDGFAYNHEEFRSYYTEHAQLMWDRARYRTYQVSCIWEQTLLSSEAYAASFPTGSPSWGLPPHSLYLLPGLRTYIPVQCWPHEPLGMCPDQDEEGQQWAQFAPWFPLAPSPNIFSQSCHQLTWSMTYNTHQGKFLVGQLGHSFKYSDLTRFFQIGVQTLPDELEHSKNAIQQRI
jgi:hypothetical protein